ncbi:MAG: protein kinase [Acidobacteriota bacterium]
MSPWAPDTPLGPYILIAAIGSGGMGEVWKARDTRLNRTVAIKRLKNTHSTRFEQEARAIAALNHPHICQIYDVGPGYLVMEYIEGHPFSGPLAPGEAVRLAIQIASALEDAHSKAILHRDLKPANILIGAGGAKLLDFGLAKEASNSDATQTIEGMVMGTIPYMSPEQAEGKPVDARSEVFSFGSVLYEVLSGQRAFDSLVAVARDEPSTLKVPEALRSVIAKCLKKAPQDRFQSMTELRTALQNITAKPQDQQPSIAVLPFANMSADPEQEYFSDGLAEEIINALAQIPGLKVIARTSAFAFKGKQTDIRQIAETLGVAHVLEGSVRKAANRIRITAQLIAAHDGSHLWSERYDRNLDDIFAVQDEIATTIVGKLHAKLSTSPAVRRKHIPKMEAHEAYLKGVHSVLSGTPQGFATGNAYYEQAISLDPGYALPHAGQGFAYNGLASSGLIPSLQAMPLVQAAAERALALDPDLPEAHALLGSVAAVLHYDWARAEGLFRKAISCDPVPAFVLVAHASRLLLPAGRLIEAMSNMDRAVQQDPLNPVVRLIRTVTLWGLGRDEDATSEVTRLVHNHPGGPLGFLLRAFDYYSRGMLDQMREAAEHAIVLAPGNLGAVACLAYVASAGGDSIQAEHILDQLRPGTAYGAPLALATYHAMRNEWEEAARWLDAAVEQRDFNLLPFFQLPHLRGFRASPYWPPLRQKLNLPEE